MTDHRREPFSSLPVAPPFPDEPPPRRAGTNGFAIAAFVLGFCSLPLSIIFGIIALVQIRRDRQAGKGFAITGVVMGGAWLVLLGIGLLSTITEGADRDASGEIADGGTVSLEDLRPGDCVSDVTEGAVGRNLPAVPCAEAHEGEVYAVHDMGTDYWPGEEAITKQAARCVDQLAADYPAAYADPQVEVFYLAPATEGSWLRGERTIICIARFLDGPRTGSLRG